MPRTCFGRCMTARARADGYVSLEVSPYLAHDTEATIDEARRLWKAVARENVMIKVPASTEGLPAIRELTSEGINVNITLLFGIERYEAVARAYMEGLSTFVRNGGDPAHVCSVASFFVSRIDTMVDGLIATRLATATRSRAPHLTDRPSRNSRDCQRQARLSALPGAVPYTPSGSGSLPGERIHNVSSGRAPAPRIHAIATSATLRS